MPQGERTITFTIDRDKVTIESEGYVGTECKDATKAYEKVLGDVTKDEPKAAMYENVASDVLQDRQTL